MNSGAEERARRLYRLEALKNLSPKERVLLAYDLALKAANEGDTNRLRPILLTAGSAVLGFLHMMLDTSESGALWRPLAVAMVFGLLTSTVLTLFVTPTLTYLLLEDLPRRLGVVLSPTLKTGDQRT